MDLYSHIQDGRPLMMGVLNYTPDSFSDGGDYFSVNKALDQVKKMMQQGADIIDIGAQSSRPGSKSITQTEELGRIKEIIPAIRKQSDIPLSIDTNKAAVAQYALSAGVDLVNDISACGTESMIDIIKFYQVPVVIMHMQGDPKSMQKKPVYQDVVLEISNFFNNKIAYLKKRGVDKIIIDPGIGFGKTNDHNWEILRNLYQFKNLKVPLMIGVSRKNFLKEISGFTIPNQRDLPTLGIFLLIHRFINIFRLHHLEQIKYINKWVNG